MVKRKNATHKQRKQKQKGGGLSRLPGTTVVTTLEDFNAIYDTFLIAAHGGLMDEFPLVIPANTYVLNLSPSCKIYLDDKITEGIFYTPSAKGLGSYTDTFEKFVQNPRTYIKSLYDPLSPVISDANIEQNARLQLARTSIYEPSDKLRKDIFMNFSNYNFFGGIGVFKVPIPGSIQDIITDFDNEITKLLAEGKKPEEIQAQLEVMDEEFINLPENLIGQIIKRRGNNKFSLSQLLQEPELQAQAGKKRFIIIQTCMGLLPLDEETWQIRKARTIKKRRNSILEQRRKNYNSVKGMLKTPDEILAIPVLTALRNTGNFNNHIDFSLMSDSDLDSNNIFQEWLSKQQQFKRASTGEVLRKNNYESMSVVGKTKIREAFKSYIGIIYKIFDTF